MRTAMTGDLYAKLRHGGRGHHPLVSACSLPGYEVQFSRTVQSVKDVDVP